MTTSVLDQLRSAATIGTPVSFGDGGRPEPGSDPEGTRSVAAEDLVALLLDPSARHHRGLDVTGLIVTGTLDLAHASLDRPLALRGCCLELVALTDAELRTLRLSGSTCTGVYASGATFHGSLMLDEVIVSTGPVSLLGATVSGSLDLSGARLLPVEGVALMADRVTVTGSVFLNRGFLAHGAVKMIAASIGGSLDGSGARICNRGHDALVLDRANVAGPIFLNQNARIVGEVRMLAVTAGQVELGSARLSNARGDALSLHRATINGTLFLDDGFTAIGSVCLPGAEVRGSVLLSSATVVAQGRTSVDLGAARITGSLVMDAAMDLGGVVNLCHTHATVLEDERAGWPDVLLVDGFRYEGLRSDAEGWKERRHWLARQPKPQPAAYLQLAAVYRARGDDLHARKTLIERHTAPLRHDRPTRWREREPGWPRRAGGQILRAVIGHGYEPWRVLWFLLPVVAVMSLWYAHAAHEDLLVSTKREGVKASLCTSAHPCVQPVVLALDTVVPVVDLGQRGTWAPDPSQHSARFWDDGRWLAVATWVTAVLGWVFASLIVAGFSSVIRRD